MRIHAAALSAGEVLRNDPALRDKLNDWLVDAVAHLAGESRNEIADLISSTVAGWDGQDTSERIELQVGTRPAVHPYQRNCCWWACRALDPRRCPNPGLSTPTGVTSEPDSVGRDQLNPYRTSRRKDPGCGLGHIGNGKPFGDNRAGAEFIWWPVLVAGVEQQ